MKYYHKLLIQEAFARWKTGAVLPGLHDLLKDYENNPIDENVLERFKGYNLKPLNKETYSFIKEIIREYGDKTGPELAVLMMVDDTAFSINKDKLYIEPEDFLKGRL